MRLRHVLLWSARLGDLLLLGVCAGLAATQGNTLFIWLLIALAVVAWGRGGGMSPWRRSDVRAFMANAKRYGL